MKPNALFALTVMVTVAAALLGAGRAATARTPMNHEVNDRWVYEIEGTHTTLLGGRSITREVTGTEVVRITDKTSVDGRPGLRLTHTRSESVTSLPRVTSTESMRSWVDAEGLWYDEVELDLGALGQMMGLDHTEKSGALLQLPAHPTRGMTFDVGTFRAGGLIFTTTGTVLERDVTLGGPMGTFRCFKIEYVTRGSGTVYTSRGRIHITSKETKTTWMSHDLVDIQSETETNTWYRLPGDARAQSQSYRVLSLKTTKHSPRSASSSRPD